MPAITLTVVFDINLPYYYIVAIGKITMLAEVSFHRREMCLSKQLPPDGIKLHNVTFLCEITIAREKFN